jgi:hypothetical protein
MNTSSFCGVERGRRVGLTTLQESVSRLSRQCEILNISQTYRPSRPVTGIALLFFTLVACSSTFACGVMLSLPPCTWFAFLTEPQSVSNRTNMKTKASHGAICLSGTDTRKDTAFLHPSPHLYATTEQITSYRTQLFLPYTSHFIIIFVQVILRQRNLEHPQLMTTQCTRTTKNTYKKELRGLSRRANYTDRATAACRRS